MPLAGLFQILPAGNVSLHDKNLQILCKRDEREEYGKRANVVKAAKVESQGA